MLLTPTKQPIFNVPTSVVVLCGIMLAIYAIQANVSDLNEIELIRQFAFVPARVSYYFDPASAQAILTSIGQTPEADSQTAMAQFFLDGGQLKPWTFLTYAFLHGSWSHVILNSVWFLSFGAAVARRFEAVRFGIFLCVTAIAGALMHYVVHRMGVQPVIGASAAVSGCMGAALRFVFAPGAPLGEANGLSFLKQEAAYHLPATTLPAVLQNSKVMSFFGVWFAINLVVGVGSTTFGLGDAPIAWEAHVGGLLAGFLLFPLFDGLNRS